MDGPTDSERNAMRAQIEAFDVLDGISKAQTREKVKTDDVTVYRYMEWFSERHGRTITRRTARDHLNRLLAEGHFNECLLAVRPEDNREVSVWRKASKE